MSVLASSDRKRYGSNMNGSSQICGSWWTANMLATTRVSLGINCPRMVASSIVL